MPEPRMVPRKEEWPKRLRCTECFQEFDIQASVVACPGCGSKEIPEDCALDTRLTLNWHSLRVICQWAERYAETFSPDEPAAKSKKYLEHIFELIREQQTVGAGPLTFGDEIAQLREAYPDVQVHTSPPREPPGKN